MDLLNHAKYICIYCMGDYGFKTFYELKRHGYKVSFFADQDEQKHGITITGLNCLSYEQVLELDKNGLIIAAKKNPEYIIDLFKQQGFKYVVSYLDVLNYLKDKPDSQGIDCLTLEEIHCKKKEFERLLNPESVTLESLPKVNQAAVKVLEVNYTDLPGKIFNGYELQRSLNSEDMEVWQTVLDKRSDDEKVIELEKDTRFFQQVPFMEREYSIHNLLTPFGKMLENLSQFQNADIVHYHIIHNGVLSMLDIPHLMNRKHSVWTIHDPWIVTGKCIHPLECERWKTGCINCKRYKDVPFAMRKDNTHFMWEVKKELFSKINPEIVVSSNFMYEYIKKSPLTEHFTNIRKIPFGVDIRKYDLNRKNSYKNRFSIQETKLVIGFRADSFPIKGCEYIYDALRNVSSKEEMVILCVGTGHVPNDIKTKYQVIELGWVDDEQTMIEFLGACDIFLMPSLAESFGLMSIEAMAAGAVVVCFKGTVLEEITEAPEIGIAVGYKSASQIAEVINQLNEIPENMRKRSIKGHELVRDKYQYSIYLEKHRDLYRKMLEENRNEA